MKDDREKRFMLRMKTPQEVRRAIARAVNLAINEEITTAQAHCVIQGGNAILNSIRTDEQQKAIDELRSIVEDLTENR